LLFDLEGRVDLVRPATHGGWCASTSRGPGVLLDDVVVSVGDSDGDLDGDTESARAAEK
jgi:hypothetical protein